MLSESECAKTDSRATRNRSAAITIGAIVDSNITALSDLAATRTVAAATVVNLGIIQPMLILRSTAKKANVHPNNTVVVEIRIRSAAHSKRRSVNWRIARGAAAVASLVADLARPIPCTVGPLVTLRLMSPIGIVVIELIVVLLAGALIWVVLIERTGLRSGCVPAIVVAGTISVIAIVVGSEIGRCSWGRRRCRSAAVLLAAKRK